MFLLSKHTFKVPILADMVCASKDVIIHARCNSNPHLSSRCACGSCIAVENPIEAVCCREIGAVVNLLEEEEATCITDHLGFDSCCLDRPLI